MKNWCLSAAIALISVSSFAQPDTLWSRYLSLDTSSVFLGGAEMSNGDYVLVGVTGISRTLTTQNQDMLVTRWSPDGDLLWSHEFSGTSYTHQEQATSVVELPSGDLRVVGWQDWGTTDINYGILTAISASGVPGEDWRWGGGATDLYLHDAAPGANNTVAMVGQTRGPSPYTWADITFAVRSTNGDSVFGARYGLPSQPEVGTSLLSDESGYLIAGHQRPTGSPSSDYWLIRTNTAGAPVWNRTYGNAGTSTDECYGLARNVFGELFLAGRTGSNGQRGFIVKTDSAGIAIWSRTIDTGDAHQFLHGVAARPAGGAVCAGTSGESTTHRQYWMTFHNADGDSELSWVYGPEDSSGFKGVFALSNGGWLAYGAGVVNGRSQGYLLRLTAPQGLHGTVSDRETSEPQSNVRVSVVGLNKVSLTNEAGYYALELAPGTYDLALSGPCVEADTILSVTVVADPNVSTNLEVGVPDYVQVNTSFNLLVMNEITASLPAYIYNAGSGVMNFRASATGTAPRGVWISASPESGFVPAHDSAQVWITVTADTTNNGVFEFAGEFRIVTNSCPDSVDVIPVFVTVLDADGQPLTPQRFALHEAYPNPFNAASTIRYELSRPGEVRLAVYDLGGRLVSTLVDGRQSAGTHEVQFDGTDFASGLYFCRLQSSEGIHTTKLVLLK